MEQDGIQRLTWLNMPCLLCFSGQNARSGRRPPRVDMLHFCLISQSWLQQCLNWSNAWRTAPWTAATARCEGAGGLQPCSDKFVDVVLSADI